MSKSEDSKKSYTCSVVDSEDNLESFKHQPIPETESESRVSYLCKSARELLRKGRFEYAIGYLCSAVEELSKKLDTLAKK